MCKTGGPRCASHQAKTAATQLIPRRGKLHDYYLGADKRHLPTARSHATGTGSQFLDPTLTTMNDVVALAWKQRPLHLEGDDRKELIALGAPTEAFNEGVRYLKVETPGTLGITHSANLPDSTPVLVVRTKPTAALALAVESDEAPHTTYGTIIIGKDPTPTNPTREIVYTAHPGHPIPSTPDNKEDDPFTEYEGQTITLGQARATLGRETWLQTIPRKN